MNYVDVDVFMYWLTDHPDFGEAAARILQRIEAKEDACTSSLTFWLLHVIFEREVENYSEKILIDNFLKLENLKIVPLAVDDFTNAVECMEEFGIGLEDSLHYAVAKRMGSQVIYSNDADFDKTDIERRFE